jgi:hypothetical protein
VHFGIGGAKEIRRIEIRWPSGTVQVVSGAEPGGYRQIEEPKP